MPGRGNIGGVYYTATRNRLEEDSDVSVNVSYLYWCVGSQTDKEKIDSIENFYIDWDGATYLAT